LFGGGASAGPAASSPAGGALAASGAAGGGAGIATLTTNVAALGIQAGIAGTAVYVLGRALEDGISTPFDGDSILDRVDDYFKSSRDAIDGALKDAGPAQTEYINKLIELNGGWINGVRTIAAYEEHLAKIEPVMADLISAGFQLGDTLDEQTVNTLYLVEALGGLDEAIPQLNRYLEETHTEAERAAISLEGNRARVDELNQTLGLRRW